MAEIEGYQHGGKRANLPTDQTEAFMSEQDKTPVRYVPPIRNRSGPALSWDRAENLDEIATDATPLYINEKIHPSAFIAQLQSLDPAPMFGDFNGLPKDATYEWYQHEGNWSNRLIRGDSVKVMASLLAKEGMEGKVQMIYMDPPYGIGFKSNLQVATDDRNTPANANALPADPTFVQTFRDTYENGIHSYLDNLYRNFVHARALLSESGSIFVQIGSENVSRVALVLDEVFGSENQVAVITFVKTGSSTATELPSVANYLLWYAKSRERMTFRQVYLEQARRETIARMSWNSMIEMPDRTTRNLTATEQSDPDTLQPAVRIYQRMPLTSQHVSTTGRSEPYTSPDGNIYHLPGESQWRIDHAGLGRLWEMGRLCELPGAQLAWKRYENELPGHMLNNLWGELMRPKDAKYVVETGAQVIERCIQMTTDPSDIVMDITCGGGTTAYVAEQWGRRWITTDTSGVALAIARQRLLASAYDWYHLQDSEEGALEEARLSGKPHADVSDDGSRDPAQGFVYKRVPRVSAAILAYDQEVDPILLVNQPLVKRGVVRVASPFTVESHSPWRYIAPDQAIEPQADHLDTRQRMIDAIQVSGVRAGEETLRVEDIADWGEPTLVTHTAVSIDQEGKRRRTALAVVPDDQTASEEFIARAAHQAADRRLQRLIVIAFNFDASAHTGPRQYGALQVVRVAANRDFQIPGLEDNPTDRAFVMIGQPEVVVYDESNGNISVEVLGYDTYNPSTGNVERGGANDIDCWMIDTQYDGNAFYARRIHLPNSRNDKRLNRLRRRLGKRVDPKLWESMQSTRSAPFRRPQGDNPRIAARIITRTAVEMTVELDPSN